jgi:hypothetical protein
MQYYLLAENIICFNKPYRRTDPTHRVGMLLYEYFNTEPKAIEFLEDVSFKMIERLNTKARKDLLSSKPPRTAELPQLIPGQNNNGVDDLWRHDANSWVNSPFSDPDLLEPAFHPAALKRRYTPYSRPFASIPYHRPATPATPLDPPSLPEVLDLA